MLRCIAIDDEPIALSIISRYCERRGGIELETYSSPRLGMQRVCESSLPPSCCLIFTTAYARYALDGFEVNAVDFLHKPYFYERFDRAMQKAEQWLHMHDLLRMSESPSRQIQLKSEYKNVSVSIDTILYIESIDNYVKIHLSDGTSVMSKIPLRNIERQLPPDGFVRIHRSFVVSRKRIVSFTRSEVTLEKEGKSLPVGKKYADDVMRLLRDE